MPQRIVKKPACWDTRAAGMFFLSLREEIKQTCDNGGFSHKTGNAELLRVQIERRWVAGQTFACTAIGPLKGTRPRVIRKQGQIVVVYARIDDRRQITEI